MKRILLYCMGRPGYIAGNHHAGPGLRAEHFVVALARAGCDVLVLSVDHEGGEQRAPVSLHEAAKTAVPGSSEQDSEPGNVRTWLVSEKSLASTAVAKLIEDFKPQRMVGVTAYAAWLAVRSGPDLPLWADIFGDLMSEAQSKASKSGGDWALVHFWSLLVPVLEGADAFSAVSQAQAHALVGQLGVAGRLRAADSDRRLVEVIVCAAEAGLSLDLNCVPSLSYGCEPDLAPNRDSLSDPHPNTDIGALRGSVVPADAFVVLWSGGFNTWCDADRLFDEIESAMADHSDVHFVATGGAIVGHDTKTFDRARRRAQTSRFAERIHLLGWVDDKLLAMLYDQADLGLVVERDIYERELGSENRVANWLAHGLLSATTARSDFGKQLISLGFAFSLDADDTATGLGRTISSYRSNAEAAAVLRRRARDWAQENLSFSSTAAPLIIWAKAEDGRQALAPSSTADSVIRLGLLSRPDSAIEFLTAYLNELTLGQIIYRCSRWLVLRVAAKSRRRLR